MTSGGSDKERSRFQRTRDALAGKAPDAPSDQSVSLSGTADRIREMLVTAEAVSEDIRREAKDEADRYLAKARQEADALVASRREHLERALEVLRSEGREIERRLAAVTAALEQALGDPLVSEPVADAPEAPEPVAEAAPEQAETKPERRERDASRSESPPPAAEVEAEPEADADEEPAADGKGSAHARQRALIRATQLAVQGVDRDGVKETLEREFELDDTAAIVDEILGSD